MSSTPAIIRYPCRLQTDLGIPIKSGDLSSWASQGFLLNATLTVRQLRRSRKRLGTVWL